MFLRISSRTVFQNLFQPIYVSTYPIAAQSLRGIFIVRIMGIYYGVQTGVFRMSCISGLAMPRTRPNTHAVFIFLKTCKFVVAGVGLWGTQLKNRGEIYLMLLFNVDSSTRKINIFKEVFY